MTSETKQAILKLLAQIAQQNGAERVDVVIDEYQSRVRARINGCDLGFSVDTAWRQDTCTATTDPAYARVLDLWSQVVSAAQAMEGAPKGSARGECATCSEDPPDATKGECAKSKRSCGHHCNCAWSQEACCWCGWENEA